MKWEAFLGKSLTPAQKGRYVLFQVDFYRGLGDTLDQDPPAPRPRRPPADQKIP